MKLKELGKTGRLIPSIGQESFTVGGDTSIREQEYNIRYGIDHGLTLIDTAEVY